MATYKGMIVHTKVVEVSIEASTLAEATIKYANGAWESGKVVTSSRQKTKTPLERSDDGRP